jgi:hypothetical protein
VKSGTHAPCAARLHPHAFRMPGNGSRKKRDDSSHTGGVFILQRTLTVESRRGYQMEIPVLVAFSQDPQQPNGLQGGTPPYLGPNYSELCEALRGDLAPLLQLRERRRERHRVWGHLRRFPRPSPNGTQGKHCCRSRHGVRLGCGWP